MKHLKYLFLAAALILLTTTNTTADLTVNITSPADGATINTSSVEINATIEHNSTDTLDSMVFGWDGNNYSIYDNNLLFSYSFENNTEIGENDTVINSSGFYGLNGSLGSNDTNRGNYTGGWIGQGYYFDGVDDFISLGNSSMLVLNNTNISVSVWFNGSGNILSRAIAASYANASIGLTVSSAGAITAYWGNNSNYTYLTKSGLPTGVWNNVVFVRDGLNSGTIYWNGINSSATTYSQDIPNIIHVATALQISKAGSAKFNGSIDELKVYNRSLSQDEVLMIYNSRLQKTNSTTLALQSNLTHRGSGNITYSLTANTTDSVSSNDTQNINIPCIDFSTCDGNITYSTKFCNGLFYRNASTNSLSAIVVHQDNVILSGNNTQINGSLQGYGVQTIRNNIRIENLTLIGYNESIYLFNSYNSKITNATINGSRRSGIYLRGGENNTVKNSKIFTRQGDVFLIRAYSNKTNLSGNEVYFENTSSVQNCIILTGNNSVIERNNVHDCDVAISAQKQTFNVLIDSNNATNCSYNSDGYNTGISAYWEAQNITIRNNFIQGATLGILVQKNCSNISIINNIISVMPQDEIPNTWAKIRNGDVPACIAITPIYGSWISDGTEQYNDTLSKIQTYESTNILIANNTYNCSVKLWTMGSNNVTHDITNYWYRNFTMITEQYDYEEFWVNSSTEHVYLYRTNALNNSIPRGYKGQRYFDFILNKSMLSFISFRNRTVNVSMSYPFHLIGNISNIISFNKINTTYLNNSKQYNESNTTIRTSGILNATVITDSVSSVKLNISNLSQSPDANITYGGRIPNTFYTQRVDGVVVGNYKSDAFGNLTYNYSGTWSEHEFELNITSPSVDTCVSNQTVVLQGQNITFFSTITQGGLSISKAWFNLSSVLEINSVYSSVYDYYWITYNTSGLLGTYTLNCWVNDTDNNRANRTYSSFSVVTTTTTTTTQPSTPTTVVERKTGWAGCSNMLYLCQTGDYFHCLTCPYVVALGGHVEWFAAIILFLTCILVYLKTTTIAAPSIVALAFGGVYMVYLPIEVQHIAFLGIGMGVIGLIIAIWLPRND